MKPAPSPGGAKEPELIAAAQQNPTAFAPLYERCLLGARAVAGLAGEEPPGKDRPRSPVYLWTVPMLDPLSAAIPLFSLIHWLAAGHLVR